jgi:hypothetical protein
MEVNVNIPVAVQLVKMVGPVTADTVRVHLVTMDHTVNGDILATPLVRMVEHVVVMIPAHALRVTMETTASTAHLAIHPVRTEAVVCPELASAQQATTDQSVATTIHATPLVKMGTEAVVCPELASAQQATTDHSVATTIHATPLVKMVAHVVVIIPAHALQVTTETSASTGHIPLAIHPVKMAALVAVTAGVIALWGILVATVSTRTPVSVLSQQ